MANALERLERLEWIIDRLASRCTSSELMDHYRQVYNVCERTYYNDLKDARELLSKQSRDKERSQLFNEAVAARELLIRKAHDRGDYTLALKVEQDLAKLQGLYDQDKQKDVHIIFNWDGLPEACSDDGPVSDEASEQYNEKVDSKKGDADS